MGDVVFAAIYLLAVTLLFSSAITMLVRPSKFLDDRSDWRRNNVESRIWTRSAGLVFCLFSVLVGSALVTGSHFGRHFRYNLMIALWISFFLTPIANYLVWKFSAQNFARRALTEGINQDPAYERKLTAVYVGLLLLILAVASLRSLQ